MGLFGVVVAGCAPGAPDCAAGTVPSGLDTWFVLLVLLLVAAVVGGAALLVRRRMSDRREAGSAVSGSTTDA
jgi:hypothetical protein